MTTSGGVLVQTPTTASALITPNLVQVLHQLTYSENTHTHAHTHTHRIRKNSQQRTILYLCVYPTISLNLTAVSTTVEKLLSRYIEKNAFCNRTASIASIVHILEPLTTHPDEWAEPSHKLLVPALPHRHPNSPSPPATPLRSP